MKETPEQLKMLFRQFADDHSAEQMAEDIRQADHLLASIPCPEVSRQSLSAIKTQVRNHLKVRSHQRIRLWLTSSAAAILLLAGTLFFLKNNPPSLPEHLTASASAAAYLWSDGIIADDDPVGTLKTQIETIAGQIETVQKQNTSWFDDENSLASEIQDLQNIAANTDFWKG